MDMLHTREPENEGGSLYMHIKPQTVSNMQRRKALELAHMLNMPTLVLLRTVKNGYCVGSTCQRTSNKPKSG